MCAIFFFFFLNTYICVQLYILLNCILGLVYFGVLMAHFALCSVFWGLFLFLCFFCTLMFCFPVDDLPSMFIIYFQFTII